MLDATAAVVVVTGPTAPAKAEAGAASPL
jgi:hypothetical protein